MENNVMAVESIVKARDDRTTNVNSHNKSYLYSIMLSHIDHITANLYNFKFIGKIVDPDCSNDIFLNLQVLINDSSIVDNSKYCLKNNQARMTLVESYRLDERENDENSYRIDFSINGSDSNDPDFLLLEIVNMAYNSSSMIHINKETFFKISIFLYQMLTNNIIDGDIFIKKFTKFRIISGNLRYHEYSNIQEQMIKTYVLYWNGFYILAYIDSEVKNQINYMTFTKEEYNKFITEENQDL